MADGIVVDCASLKLWIQLREVSNFTTAEIFRKINFQADDYDDIVTVDLIEKNQEKNECDMIPSLQLLIKNCALNSAKLTKTERQILFH